LSTWTHPAEWAGELIVNLVAAFLAFITGVLFSDPIQARVAQWRRLHKLRKLRPTFVRIFPIIFPLSLDELSHLLLRQNRLQSFFQLELVHWEAWTGHGSAEARLRALRTDSRLEFAEKFQAEMNAYNDACGATENLINVAISNLAFPKNFYCWNTRDRRGIVIGINSLHNLFGEDPGAVNKIILRIVQRMLLYSLAIRSLKAHQNTRGCLFDLTPLLTDLKYSVDKTFLCSECERAIADDRGMEFLEAARLWVEGRKVKTVTAV